MASASDRNSWSDDETDRGDRWFCHKCAAPVTGVNETEMICPQCHTGFLEKMEPDEHSQQQQQLNFDPHSRLPILQLMQMFAPAASGSQPNSGNLSGGDLQLNPFQGFIEQILNNLTNGGAFQVIIGQQDGDEHGSGTPQPFFFNLHGNLGDYAVGPGSFDAIVTQLLNQVEGGAPPVAKEDIQKLTKVTISKEKAELRIQCPVCFDEFKEAEVVRKLSCNHMFHDDCIIPWLERHNSCPVCRTNAVEIAEEGESPARTDSTSTSATTGNPSASGQSTRENNSSQRNLDSMEDYD